MAERWEQTGGETTYAVELDGSELVFEASGPHGERGGLVGDSERVWVEEFPDDDRWQRWVRRRLSDRQVAALQNAVTEKLEELAARRKQVFAEAVEQLYADELDATLRAMSRIRSLGTRYEDLAPNAVGEIADRLDADTDQVRRRAAEAVRDVAESDPSALVDIREDLEFALGDDHPNVRLDVARALAVLATDGSVDDTADLLEAVVETLVGLLHEHTRWFSRGPVAGLLGELGRQHPSAVEPAVEPLVRFVAGELSSGSGTSGIGRSTAVQALVEIARVEPAVVAEYADVFFDKLDSRRPGVRGRCAELLGLLAERSDAVATRATGALERRLDDVSFVADTAREALRRIRDAHPEVVEQQLEAASLERLEVADAPV